jgi:hypothetical protein
MVVGGRFQVVGIFVFHAIRLDVVCLHLFEGEFTLCYLNRFWMVVGRIFVIVESLVADSSVRRSGQRASIDSLIACVVSLYVKRNTEECGSPDAAMVTITRIRPGLTKDVKRITEIVKRGIRYIIANLAFTSLSRLLVMCVIWVIADCICASAHSESMGVDGSGRLCYVRGIHHQFLEHKLRERGTEFHEGIAISTNQKP